MENKSRSERIPGYLYAADGLRAISLIMIVMFHTWQQSWVSYNIQLSPDRYLIKLEMFQRFGYVAIDSFFVLSGFCLFYPIARDMFGESRFNGWKQFFIKRARRIYPAYVIMLAVLVLCPKASLGQYDIHSFKDVAKHLIMHLLFIHNFDPDTLGSMISTAWTMSIEVQFYLLFPLLCIPFRKKPVITCICMCVTAFVIRLALICYADINQFIMSAVTPSYLDVFGLGMLSAYFVVKFRNSASELKSYRPYMTLASMLCVIAAVFYIFWLGKVYGHADGLGFPDGFTGDVYFRFLYRGLFAAIVSVFIFSASFSYSFWEKSIWGNRFFVFLSSISYSVYLWHQNIYIFLKKSNIPYTTSNPQMTDRNAMDGMIVLCFTSSVLIGVLITKYIEAPIAKYGFKGCIELIFKKIRDFKLDLIKKDYSNDKHK